MRSEQLYFLFSPVTRIKGVGSAVSETLMRLLPRASQLGGNALPLVRDLLFHLPVGIIDRRVSYPLVSVPDGVVATFVVTVESHHPPANSRYSKKPYKVVCSNETGTLALVFFNVHGDYVKKSLPVGEQRVVSGLVERFDGIAQMAHPDVITFVSHLSDVQKIEPVYPLTAGLTSKRISKLVADAIAQLPQLPEWQEGANISFKQALIAAHNPESAEDLLPTALARVRLAYDEVLAHQLQLAILRSKMQAQAGAVIKGDERLTRQLKASLPYKLTAGQQGVIGDIAADMRSGYRMTRLLQGDVGSGKTIVALFAMLKAVEEGYQCALMVPTELIARQHYEVIGKLLAGMGVKVVLHTGSIKGGARKEILSDIESGNANIIVGTHALFQEQVNFRNLALVVIDEQHRFGVAQRMALTQKGEAPHILHMTATPIPRSLTMLLYGDMDASLLKEKPANRLPITTRAIPAARFEEMAERLKAALDRGEKAYWICPMIEDSESDLAAATTRHKEFTARFGDVVGLVHGRMKADERDAAMQKFHSGETKLLVATTVVEVGVDISDATIIVIEEAQRFGLSQLHQLRGRVGRGDKPSACVLLYSGNASESEVAAKRLNILRETEDGFRIAEEDLVLRGGGELLGVRQSGLERTIFLDLLAHSSLVAQARDEAAHIIQDDPELKSKKGEALKILLQLFERDSVD